MNSKYIKYVIITIAMSTYSCSNNYPVIERGWWKYGEGFHIGDVVKFNEYNHLSNDTIYYQNQALGTIQLYTKKRMIIKDIESNTRGLYHHKY